METGLTTQAVAREVRLRQWQEIIHARQESGLTVKDYCESHGITKDSYYYWQRLVREAAIAEAGPMFAELLPGRQEKREEFLPELTVRIGGAVISVNRDTPTDLRRGIDGLVSTVKCSFHLNPSEEGSIFLFCGRRADRIKALVYEGDGFLLLYKRLADGRFQWPRTRDEVKQINPQQYRWLMEGLCIEQKKAIREVKITKF